jgi:hypothetical protein
MDFLHTDFHGGRDTVVLVTLDGRANVMLLDDLNFSAYQGGRAFNYFGGWATTSPVRLVPPHTDHWHVVVDLGGASGTVRASVRIVGLQSTNA